MENGFPKVKIQGIYEYFKDDVELFYNESLPITDNISFNVEHDYELKTTPQEDNLFCPYLWQRLTITASGLTPLCISDWDLDEEIGNLKNVSIKDICLGKRMEA